MNMKITDNISANLSAWMSVSESLDSIKKVSVRSKVGFGTVQRTKNGDGNPTITNLCDIAHAFGRRVEDLLALPEQAKNVVSFSANEPQAQIYSPIERELLELAGAMNEQGKWQLIGMAKVLAHEYPRKKKHARK